MNTALLIYSPLVRLKGTAVAPQVSGTKSTTARNLGSCSQGEDGIQRDSINTSQDFVPTVRKR